MRTTLDLPTELLDQARKISGERTKRGAVVAALQEYVNAELRRALMGRLGKTRMMTQADLAEMRGYNEPPDPNQPVRLILPAKGKHPFTTPPPASPSDISSSSRRARSDRR